MTELEQMIQDFIAAYGGALGDDLDFAVRAVRDAWLPYVRNQ